MMKIFVSYYYLFFVVLFLVVGCNDDDPAADVGDRVGAVRPFGEMLGEVTYFDIGEEGGTIGSASGDIEITIPEGALSSNVTIALQAVENTAPNGTGASYRITPHDIAFKKPVVITMVYGDSVSLIDGMGIAYQAEDGIWYWPGLLEHDRESHKISVETTHFSDWSIFESIKISPTYAVVEPGGEIKLTALGTFPDDIEDDLLTPLVPDLLTPLVPEKPVPLGEPKPMDPSYIKAWNLRGAGSVTSSGNVARYKAPLTVPEDNEAIVYAKLTLKSGKSWTLMSTIIIGGSEIILNGGPYSNLRAVSKSFGVALYHPKEGLTGIRYVAQVDNFTSIGVTISFPAKTTGKFSWNNDNCFVMTAESTVGSSRLVAGTVDTEDDEVHAGFIEVIRYPEVGGVMTGKFEGGFTFIDSSCANCKLIGSVRGTFSARRTQ